MYGCRSSYRGISTRDSKFLSKFEYAHVSIPIAILIWLMIYPMMIKVDFKSVRNIRNNPKGLYVTWITNWLIKPFTMYGIAYLFFFVIFKSLINPNLARDYLSGGPSLLSPSRRIFFTVRAKILEKSFY